MITAKTKRKGRRPGATEGAAEAVAKVYAHLENMSLNPNSFSAKHQLTPSSVWRALTQKPARWTPTLVEIYRIAVNKVAPEVAQESQLVDDLRRCPPPAGAVVRRLLADLGELVSLAARGTTKE